LHAVSPDWFQQCFVDEEFDIRGGMFIGDKRFEDTKTVVQ